MSKKKKFSSKVHKLYIDKKALLKEIWKHRSKLKKHLSCLSHEILYFSMHTNSQYDDSSCNSLSEDYPQAVGADLSTRRITSVEIVFIKGRPFQRLMGLGVQILQLLRPWLDIADGLPIFPLRLAKVNFMGIYLI